MKIRQFLLLSLLSVFVSSAYSEEKSTTHNACAVHIGGDLNVKSKIEAMGCRSGIAKMIDEDKYCIDILNQIKAVSSAITSVESRILKTHMTRCVKDALKSEKEFNSKFEELMKTLKR